MNVNEKLNPNHEKKTFNALKANKIVHRVTFNPNKALPGETLRVSVPKLHDGVVLDPESLALIFNLSVTGHANTYVVNNLSRALVDRLTVKFAGEMLQDTDGCDLFKLYEDLFLTENERENMLKEGIQSVDLAKIRCNSRDKKIFSKRTLTESSLSYMSNTPKVSRFAPSPSLKPDINTCEATIT